MSLLEAMVSEMLPGFENQKSNKQKSREAEKQKSRKAEKQKSRKAEKQ